MATLEDHRILQLLEPYLGGVNLPGTAVPQLSMYLDLLVKWNARTNLTAIRDPAEIVRRHFGESLFAGLHLPEAETLLDYGSGAGFPGLPIQILRPELHVTLAESQHKKASFLREVVRTLSLETEIWADRVEALPQGRRFDVITLRAVDNMDAAADSARRRLKPGGTLALLTSGDQGIRMPGRDATVLKLERL